jgi:signal transduction histidine kinase/CheY-like chemotaxis protein
VLVVAVDLLAGLFTLLSYGHPRQAGVTVGAGLAALASSVLLLVTMLALLRTYFATESARRASRLAQLDAERLNRAKSGFLSRVSHELRTPLNAILGFGQLLERGPLADAERESVGHILTAGRHLLVIVDDLLDLSRIEAEELRLSLEPVQLADALEQVRALIAPAAADAAVGVRQRPIDAHLFVRADRGRLIQVLLNLASNAVKYNRPGGNVVISAVATPSGTARIEVADTGIGIASEQAERLFVPFERLGADGRGIEGTGLGLALARGLTEAMGGSLELSSAAGAGTTFTVELPLAAAPAQPAGSSLARSSASEGVPTPRGLPAAVSVLYVEDNPSNIRLVEQILGLSSEIALSTAESGAAGIELARELAPDLILLDLHLPDMSGEQVLAAVRSDAELASTPVVVVSADASPAQARRLLATGADGYLTKPFDIEQLLDAVRNRGTSGPLSAASEGSAETPLEPATVAALRRLAANVAVGPSQLGQMLETFHEDALATLISLHGAVAQARLAEAAREAHRLAGSAGAVGAGGLRRAARAIERSARDGDHARVVAIDLRLDGLLAAAWAALADEFAGELRLAASTVAPPSAR